MEAVARNASGTFVQLALYVGPLGVVGVVGDQGVASESQSACSVERGAYKGREATGGRGRWGREGCVLVPRPCVLGGRTRPQCRN